MTSDPENPRGPDRLFERRAQLSNLRQELVAPVSAIIGYGEMLREDVVESGPGALLPDLDRILKAAGDLHQIADQLYHQEADGAMRERGDDAHAIKLLRHDLRTPINAIKGYGEMLLEDLTAFDAERLRADLTAMLQNADQLLRRIETFAGFRDHVPDAPTKEAAAPNASGDAARAMFANLATSLRPDDVAGASAAAAGVILIVDDLESNRSVLSRRLSRDGHAVTSVESGQKALELLRRKEFDLVLLDLMMPEMNGYEVLSRLKSDPALRRIPVIMISALDEIDSVVRCIEAGAEDYLSKPFDPTLLRARINASLEKKQWRLRERSYLDRIEAEKEKFERLLLSVLPQKIITRLNDGETLIADRFDEASVLFSDLVGFTEISTKLSPADLVTSLNALFSEFDALAQELGVEKVKMIGDAYMVVAGVPEPRADHAEAIARMGIGMVEIVERVNRTAVTPFDIRVGIHSGPVVAGIIGTHRFLYDVWGDTVNVASRLEATCPPNRVQISEETALLLSQVFETERRDDLMLKGKGAFAARILTAAQA